MRLENILALTHGRLVNDPFVKIFENIVFDSKAIKRGDLFIAFDEEMIEDAIFNGAYGIVFDKPTQITDNEIAWIKVNNCENSLKRVLRFKLVEKNILAYSCNEIVLKLALQTITEQKFVIISGEIKSIYKQLLNLEDSSTILFSPALSDEDIFTNINELPKISKTQIILKEHTLFETSFIYEKIFYERQQLSPFFIPYLEDLLGLYKKLKINFRLKKFNPTNNFEVTFVNNSFEIKEFGTTDKVLIFESNEEFIESEIDYLNDKASWSEIIYILPSRYKTEYNNKVYRYDNEDEIINILKNNFFNFALIVGVDKSVVCKPIIKQTQLTLDF
ncbi:MAG: hypothetical protein U9P72_00945 [Campylobacterota bacterium]|nr:hypothetical protein [Campylobacterota bacterium]